jgi:non-ribosomal peptide synthase protein (TIGR01720 family)
VVRSLTAEESRILLGDALLSQRATITDVLMTALASALARWTGTHAWIIEMVGHGRVTMFDDIDLSRTIGWLVTHTPVLLNLEAACDVKANLQNIKEQIRRIPHYGFGYEVLRYLSEDREVTDKLISLPQSEIIFNFLGRSNSSAVDTLIAPVEAYVGPTGVHKNVPKFLLIFNGIIIENQLYLKLTYSEEVYDRSTIEHLARYVIDALSKLIAS